MGKYESKFKFGDCELRALSFDGVEIRLKLFDGFNLEFRLIVIKDPVYFMMETDHMQNVIGEIKFFSGLPEAVSDENFSEFLNSSVNSNF
ncbi:MAG: hypothetical protein ACREDP_09605, partial [Bradyrhizobium sp.]